MSMTKPRVVPTVASLVAALLMIGCDDAPRNQPPPAEPSVAAGGAGAVETEGERTILFLGTSLTAGLGLPTEEAFPALVQQKVDSAGLPFRVVNAGVSGETSAGALRRVDWLLRQPFHVVVVETGANDMLRGADLDSTRANIQAIVDRVRAERPEARIVLAGMQAPPNLGPRYAEQFRAMYEELARDNGLTLIPFLLQDVGGVRELNLPDGIHPNAEGQRVVAANVWAVLGPALQEMAAGG
jgi:acyl-CoA thioesterase I